MAYGVLWRKTRLVGKDARASGRSCCFMPCESLLFEGSRCDGGDGKGEMVVAMMGHGSPGWWRDGEWPCLVERERGGSERQVPMVRTLESQPTSRAIRITERESIVVGRNRIRPMRQRSRHRWGIRDRKVGCGRDGGNGTHMLIAAVFYDKICESKFISVFT